ncbi:phage holin family protein [Terricaulis sp.]|uniref:phage holin family protein n=1 Tax=Terricaulis sp. TaxID=2768686 RepID=UPI002AC700E5|nr:phage holin family protein [Terricaulis sp.]MDZ4690780.1 phage holin family protein [Terricaulis sp.]
MQAERSLSQLAKDLTVQVSDLMRNEVRLARAETIQVVKGMGAGVMRAALGVVLAGAAVTLVLFALAYLLAETMPLWMGALLSAAVGAIAAYLLIKSGLKSLSEDRPALPRTTENVSRDLHVIKERTS